jgi:CheY-like chemotaxis protein/signal transduction histidine kinase
MNPLYIILQRLSKKLEQHADLWVVNRLLVVYIVNILGILVHLGYGVIALITHHTTMAIFLLSVSFALIITLGLLFFYKLEKLSKVLITIIASLVMFYLLYSGGTDGSGHLWMLLFPVWAIPLFGLSRGNIVSFIFFLISITYFLLQRSFHAEVLYSLTFVLRLLGAYAIIHLLVYMIEYLKFHNYSVLEKRIIDTQTETRQKDDFLSKLSHQIRTPLNNITVISNLVNKAKLDAEHRDLFDTILASTINLINVVNNIVKVSEVKIEKELNSQVNFDLYSSIDNTLKLFRDQHKDRLEIDFKLRNIKSNYIGDPIRIKQIFLNIIENIIKANQSGKLLIDIEISINNDHENDSELNFQIRCPQLKLESDDYGNFYSRPNENLVKEGLYQPDDYFIDFNIAKKIINYYGGELNITSSNEFTILAFALVLKKGTAGIHKTESEKDASQLIMPKHLVNLNNANILLVEDNAINQKIIILSLKNHVKNIDIANNGKDALDKFGKTKYDLILMDIQMPVINGIAATKKIRELESSSNTQTPIIAITANALSGDKESCLAAGMNDYISKPFQVDILVNKMKVLLEA